MRTSPRAPTLFLLLIFLILSGGCTSILVAGAGGGIAYTVTNVAYKTVSYPLVEVDSAVRVALKKMGIREVLREQTGESIKITAETPDLTIYVSIDMITPKASRISVDARKNFIMKDVATAAEIIEQTDRVLENKELHELSVSPKSK
ncbi:MAG: DUF3568 family protein [Dissulfurispiraceae bacterium]|jgi:hypothetical protein